MASGAPPAALPMVWSVAEARWSARRSPITALREPGLFGREFRSLQLGRFVGGAAVAALAVVLLAQLLTGRSWPPADDVLYVLACSFVLQALAVVHGLKQAGSSAGCRWR